MVNEFQIVIKFIKEIIYWSAKFRVTKENMHEYALFSVVYKCEYLISSAWNIKENIDWSTHFSVTKKQVLICSVQRELLSKKCINMLSSAWTIQETYIDLFQFSVSYKINVPWPIYFREWTVEKMKRSPDLNKCI